MKGVAGTNRARLAGMTEEQDDVDVDRREKTKIDLILTRLATAVVVLPGRRGLLAGWLGGNEINRSQPCSR